MTCKKRRKLPQIPHLIHPSHCQDLSLSLSLGHVHAPTTTSEVTPVIGPESIQMSSMIPFVQGPHIACSGSSHCNREGEGGAGAVSSGGRWLVFCSHGCSRLCSCGDPFMGENAHGMPFEAILLAPSHAVLSEKGSRVADFWRKRKVCGVTSARKGADSRIFGKKGRCVARPPCHFPQLGEKGRWVAQPQQGKVPTRGFSAKKETVWRDLKICQIFFISLCTSTD